MQGQREDILLAADPTDPLFSVQSPSSDWRPAVGLDVMGIRTARFLWCNGTCGPRQQGNAMVGDVLVHGGSERVSTRPWSADAMVRSFRYPQSGKYWGMGRGRRLFFLFGLDGSNCPMGAASNACDLLQQADKVFPFRSPFSMAQPGRTAHSMRDPNIETFFSQPELHKGALRQCRSFFMTHLLISFP